MSRRRRDAIERQTRDLADEKALAEAVDKHGSKTLYEPDGTSHPAEDLEPGDDEEAPPAKGSIIGAIFTLLGLALILPFMGGIQNIIGIAIMGFALWEAWKLNAPKIVLVQGPYFVKPKAGP